VPGYNLYFGDLHAHTGYSDGAAGDPDALAGAASDAVTRVEIVSDGGAVVRSLTLSPAAGVKTVTWKVAGLPAKAR
jgi:hypothetical protein